MIGLVEKIAEAVAVIRQKWALEARAGVVLGTGLGGLSDAIAVDAKFDYSEVPHFPRSTTIGHSGFLVCGRVDGLPIVAMEGRFHAYEGYTYQQITFPVRVMRAL